MAKNIVIGILVVFCSVLIVYGRIQRTEAKKYEAIALENAKEAAKHAKLAELNAMEA